VAFVRLIDEDDIDIGARAARESLCAADLNGLRVVRPLVIALYDSESVDAFTLERRDGLVD
jgi:hypothetical protein